MFIIQHRKIFLIISATLVALSLASLLVFGVNVGIDFKGGALTEVVYQSERPAPEILNESLNTLGIGSILLQPTGELGYLVKTRDLTEAEHASLFAALSLGGEFTAEEASFTSVGPSVGKELVRKSIFLVILVSLGIIGFIAFAFRKVSSPHGLVTQAVPSWKYGLIAVATLFHDVILPIGLFVLLSRFFGAELDTLFVVAILTILGLSVSDTIVIFDRIRENLKRQAELKARAPFSETVGKSLGQSYVRSISTSLTVILVLLALFFFGPVSTKYFALMLTAGMLVGTYSSICLASPLLVLVEERQRKKVKSLSS